METPGTTRTTPGTTRTTPATHDLPDFAGPVHRPEDEGYAARVAGFQTAYTHRPALVVGAECVEDVRRAVAYAAQRKLPVGVQATGHGLSVAADDGAVLVNTSRMNGVWVDPDTRTARIAAGVRWDQVIQAGVPYGLAPLSGSAPSVGAVGYLLGGGVGLLAREFGYAARYVRRVELVTPDARVHQLVPGDELFGAVLGGGGNFGVVTEMEIELLPVPTLYGGQLIFDEPLIDQALAAWRQLTAEAPRALTSTVAMLRFPDTEALPAPMRGRYVASFRIAYNGPAAEGERLLAPLRAVGECLVDDLREMPYAESGSIHRDPEDPMPYAATNALLSELPPEALRAVREVAGPRSPVPCVVDVRHMGGALREPGPGAPLAVDHRDARYVVGVVSLVGPGFASAEEVRERHAMLREALAPWTVGHHLGFLFGDGEQADEAQTRAGYTAATYERLAELKATYDPHNLFRLNRNIRPAAG